MITRRRQGGVVAEGGWSHVDDRYARARALIAAEPRTGDTPEHVAPSLHRVCQVAVRVVPASGASVTLVSRDGVPRPVAASNAETAALNELQLATGEGPGLEAAASARPVLVADLLGADAGRWPVFASAADSHGMRAVYAFPMQVGAIPLGTFELYREHSGPLDNDGLTWALTFAEIAVGTLLDGQSAAPDDAPAPGLDESPRYRAELYQAQGMVMIQLRTSLSDALARMRAYAFAQDRRLSDVAADVVGRRLTFTGEPDGRDDVGNVLR